MVIPARPHGLLPIALMRDYENPARMRRDKVISLSVVVVTTKITRSRHLGIWATRKCNQSVGISEELAWMCFESFVTVYVSIVLLVIVAPPIDRAHWLALLHLHCKWPGRDRRHYRSIFVQNRLQMLERGVCVLESSSWMSVLFSLVSVLIHRIFTMISDTV